MDKELRIQELEKELAQSKNRIDRLEKDVGQLSRENSDLRKKAHSYKELIRSSPSMVTLLQGKDLIIKMANEPILQFWQKDKDIIGKPLIEAHPDIKEQGLEQLLLNVMESGKPEYGYEMPVYISRGEQKELCHFNFVYQPQKDINGEVNGVAVIAREVTTQAQMHKQVKENERKYRGMADFMPHKISIADAEGTPLFYNQSWLAYTGMEMEEMLDTNWTDLVHPDHLEEVRKAKEECLATGNDLDMEIKFRDKNDDYKWHLCRAIPIKDEGVITSWISSCTEIQKLKEEEQRKQDFLKLVSHELKTPVTSIKGYVQLLQSMLEKSEDNITKPYLKRIENQVERLIRLISEMLDLSRIEQNELKLNMERFSLNEHVENIIEDISYIEKNVQIKLEHQFECEVLADKDRIGQVIINFVNNALKYSPEYKKVQVKIFKDSEDNVGVSVKDFGIGIEKNELNKIFHRFYRVSARNEKTYAGFGIGLYLSSEIIDRHNGKIFVDSEPGEGSEFTLVIPLNQN